MKRARTVIGVLALGLGAAWWASGAPAAEAPLTPPRPAVEPPREVPPAPDTAVPEGQDAGPVALTLPPRDTAWCSASGRESWVQDASLADLLAEERRRLGATPGTRLELLRALAASGSVEQARATAASFPDVVAAHVAHALEAQRAGLADESLAAVRRAWALRPSARALAFTVLVATEHAPDLGEPLSAAEALVASGNAPPAVRRLRARLALRRDLQRDDRRVVLRGVTVLFPPDVLSGAVADQVAVEVDRGLEEAARLTGTARRRALTVVVYRDRSELLAVSCAPTWAGGLYDGTLRLVAPEGSAPFDWKVLRHETLHAQLGPVAPQTPYWFHEGLAMSFAAQRWPREAWGAMVRNRTWAPFSSLDGAFAEFDAQQDAGLAYAQSYALVEYLRARSGDDAVREALAQFARGADTPTALAAAARQREVTGEDLLAFLSRRLAERGP